MLQSIQFLRFVAAFAVVLSHAEYLSALYWSKNASEAYIFGLGAIGVHIFFVISGFVMVCTTFGKPEKEMDAFEFLRRRLVRIFPIYWLYAAVCTALDPGRVGLFDVLGALLLLPGYSGNIIGQGWTLTYELYFYFWFAISINLHKTGAIVALSVFFLVSVLSRFWLSLDALTDVATNPLLIEFLVGAWIGYAKISNRIGPNPIIVLCISLALVLAGLVIGYNRFPTVISWGVPSGMLVYSMVALEARLPRVIKALSFLGDSSYSLYLIHAEVLTWLFYLVRNVTINQIALCLGLSSLVCGIAIITYTCLEAPIVRNLGGRLAGVERKVT